MAQQMYCTLHNLCDSYRQVSSEVSFIYVSINSLPGVPKNCPDLSCYFCKSACYLIKMIKKIYYEKPNLDPSICFISVCAN